jgi:hypothetical protein
VLSLLGGLAPARVPDANTLFSVAQRLAGSFGIALLATLFASQGAASLAGLREAVAVLVVAALAGAVGALWLAGPVGAARRIGGEETA